MNKLTIIGNLTRGPETRVTQSGSSVCSFTVAVNRRGQDDKTDFFRVSAWNKTGETCQKYLAPSASPPTPGRTARPTPIWRLWRRTWSS